MAQCSHRIMKQGSRHGARRKGLGMSSIRREGLERKLAERE